MRVLLHGQRFAAPRPILARAALDLPALGGLSQSPLGFGAAYFACDASGLPGAALGPAAGALFGFPLGLLIVMSSACAAAAVAFLLGRLFRPRLRRWLEKRDALQRNFAFVDRTLADAGFRAMLLLRLIPAPPPAEDQPIPPANRDADEVRRRRVARFG